jgi:hypothetical protein
MVTRFGRGGVGLGRGSVVRSVIGLFSFAALAVSHWIEHQTGWSIKKFVRTARRYRTVQIRAGQQTLTAADPLPEDLRDALAKFTSPDSAH